MLSVIIPTYNGRDKIVNALKSLENQTDQDFEVIVMIDGSTDDTAQLLKETHFHLSRLQIFDQPNAGRSIVRNNGARKAQGTILVFMDDDMTFEKNTLEKHRFHHENYPDSVVAGATFEDLNEMISDFDRYKSELRNSWLAPFNEHPFIQTERIYLSAANLSIPKHLFESVNGFDETLTDNEDHDLGVRIQALKKNIYIDTEIIGYHHENLTIKKYIHRQLQYANSKNSTFPKTLKNRIGGWFFGNNAWIRLIDSNKLVFLSPRKLRYQLYRLVIQGHLLKRLAH